MNVATIIVEGDVATVVRDDGTFVNARVETDENRLTFTMIDGEYTSYQDALLALITVASKAGP